MKHISLGELKEIGAITAIQDGNHGEKHPVSADYVDDGIPFIMASDIVDGQIDFKQCKKISRAQADTLRIGFSKTGDVLLTHKGTLGNVAIVPKVDPYIMLTPQVTYYRTNEDLLHNRFLVYAFREPSFQGRMKRFSDQSTRPYVGITNQRYLKIPFPPLHTQQKIAAILAAYDDLIENNLKRIKLLEEMAQITYEEWFVRLRFPGHESTPINPETGLPEGWTKEPLNTLSDFVFGYPFKATHFNNQGNGTPIVRIRNIPDSSTTDFTTETVDKKYLIQRGDLLVGMDGDFYINNWMSDTAYLVQRVCNIKPKNKNDLGYITEAIREPIKFYESTICGATVAHLGKKHLDEIKIISPDERIRELSNCFNDFLNQKIILAHQVHLLREARDILLPRLMTGVIDVESYDPAQLLKEAA